MFVEVHVLQSFPPSCLNRDDTNTPKDCMFGGVRRARVSSQSWKRAIRMAFRNEDALADHLAVRTKRLVGEVAAELGRRGRVGDLAAVAEVALGSAGIATDPSKSEKLTQYLLFLPKRAAAQIAEVIDGSFDAVAAAVGEPASEPNPEKPEGKKSKKKDKADAKGKLDAALSKAIGDALFRAERTPEIALFGRMIADKPDVNVDAAAQVAHAISTNEAAPEFDFYTAVDDLKTTAEDAGADMLGTVGYAAPCFYRYAVVDTEQLARNLAGGEADGESRALAATALGAFLRAMVRAIPSARQNSMAAHTPPSLVVAVVRSGGQPVSLANAFEAAVRPRGERGVVERSIESFGDHWSAIARALGQRSVRRIGVVDLTPGFGKHLPGRMNEGGLRIAHADADVDTLVDQTLSAVAAGAS